ncbi:MAG: OmpA family protein [Polyangiaceae bacterium]|nr:OmpA family protein [Polyangiaceae bacterium]
MGTRIRDSGRQGAGGLRRAVAVGAGICALIAARPAGAQALRWHGTGAGAKAVDVYQSREQGFGGALLGAAELRLGERFGLALELGNLLLLSGEAPRDPSFERRGVATAITGGFGPRVYPFAPGTALGGVWLAGVVGGTVTGGLGRPLFDAHVGYDFFSADGTLGVGPTLGYVHVFQGDRELRPEDANVLLAGVHLVYGAASAEAVRDGDRDSDGLRDSVDRCPDDPEDYDSFQDEDGCPDLDDDADGVPDVRDECRRIPEDRDGFQDEDGCPEVDNDLDGIVDSKDSCPNEPEDLDEFQDEDGCPDPDNDQDGILDKEDLCPLEPETKNDYADEDGCPDELQVRVLGDKIVLDDRVHFQVNSHIIRTVSYPLLERLAKLIVEHPEYVQIEVEGHADERGPEWYNKKLSEDRARSVMEFLITRGVERARLSAVGYGTSRPLVEKSSEHAWYMNRRVELRVTRQTKTTTVRDARPKGAESGAASAPPAGAPPAAPSAPPPAAGSAPPPPPPAKGGDR